MYSMAGTLRSHAEHSTGLLAMVWMAKFFGVPNAVSLEEIMERKVNYAGI